LLLQLSISEIPAARQLFHLQALSLSDYALAFGLGLIPVSVVELRKLLVRARPSAARTREPST
jgi:hypothetical protein